MRNVLTSTAAVATAVAALGMAGPADAMSVSVEPSAGDVSFAILATGETKKALFTNEPYEVLVGVSWEDSDTVVETDELFWQLSVDGQVMQTGSEAINGSMLLPDTISVGEVLFESSGVPSVDVLISLEAATLADGSASGATPSVIGSGISLLPLIITLGVALLTKRVELSLYMGIFWGAFIINQFSFVDAFKSSLDTYILGAVANVDNQYVMLFTLFLSGLVGMMEKSGGVFGLTKALIRYAKDSRAAQLLGVLAGCLIFFDDYANALVVGSTMRPIMDDLLVSREKLAFVVDATSAPIAAIFPISSWTGYEAGLIDAELKRIITRHGGVPDGYPETGYGLYLQSIPFRFYPFFMIVFQLVLILAKREYGPMLVAERKVRVTGRRDGGDGGNKASREMNLQNKPKENQPLRAFNMLVPVFFLVFFILFVFIRTGVDSAGEGASASDVFMNADSYSGLLFGTFAASIVAALFYQFQFKDGDNVTFPSIGGIKNAFSGAEEGPLPLLSVYECLDAWINGLLTIFPALIVLSLAWATGDIMTDIGADALFYEVIVNNDVSTALPAITFSMSFVIALCTGTSWGTMAIMFPLVVLPAFDVSNGSKAVVLGTIAAVLSGAVAGDHSSIISDTTVLASTATQCDVWRHFITQLPYALTVLLISLLLGYLPAGTGSYPAGAALVVGAIVVIIVSMAISVPVEHPSGRYDIFTEIYLKISKNPALLQLKEDTASFVSNGDKTVSPA
ncbi:Hypothetical Protein FCC1311_099352 [Hondaea fermentalgiana]|uniref:Na+/H+ antiporter NhaC-like C-terminal domain-containing protein n=1 Tax=Hondaea fermentalgiana TaxID=2315210 RepID=A0A2R5GS58_9STRA|nr:Hypothetical Protein FCC1311_099352 [Hondaea fermentalgiana]|eukprot:GBG33712.1 Hypothetical Protein FCC1311_099352 [Hondaea fermentalgiana]